jgi:hypothetical protein
VRRVPVGKTLLIAGLCALIPLLGNVAASFVTTRTGGGSWLVVPVVGVAVAMVTALIQAFGTAEAPAQPAPAPYPSQAPPGGAPPTYQQYGRREQGGTPLILALVIGLLVLGIGGIAVTQGVRFAVGYVTGNEPGTDRLVQPVTGSSDDLTITVEHVWHTRHFTRVQATTTNGGGMSVALPLGFCHLIGGAKTLDADQFRSDWPTDHPPGAVQRGTIVFKGHLPDAPTVGSLSFMIFGPSGGTLTVSPIKLKRV